MNKIVATLLDIEVHSSEDASFSLVLGDENERHLDENGMKFVMELLRAIL